VSVANGRLDLERIHARDVMHHHVEQRPKQLRARCLQRRLEDGTGRAIQFYRVHCFGAPTAYVSRYALTAE